MNAMSTPVLRVSGVYRRSPLAGSYYPAELDCVPMTRPHEYAQGLLFEQPCAAPVLVSPSQRYQLLAELLRGLRVHVPGLSCALVSLYGPDFNVPLPAELLAADVLLVHDPMEALPAVLAAGHANVVVIQQDLRTDGPEHGHNRLAVSLWRPEPAEQAAAWLRAWMNGCRMLRALSEPRLEPLTEEQAA